MWTDAPEKAHQTIEKALEVSDGVVLRVQPMGASGRLEDGHVIPLCSLDEAAERLRPVMRKPALCQVSIVQPDSDEDGKTVLRVWKPAGRRRSASWPIHWEPPEEPGRRNGGQDWHRPTHVPTADAQERIDAAKAKRYEVQAKLEEAEAQARIERLSSGAARYDDALAAELVALREEMREMKSNPLGPLAGVAPLLLEGLKIWASSRSSQPGLTELLGLVRNEGRSVLEFLQAAKELRGDDSGGGSGDGGPLAAAITGLTQLVQMRAQRPGPPDQYPAPVSLPTPPAGGPQTPPEGFHTYPDQGPATAGLPSQEAQETAPPAPQGIQEPGDMLKRYWSKFLSVLRYGAEAGLSDMDAFDLLDEAVNRLPRSIQLLLFGDDPWSHDLSMFPTDLHLPAKDSPAGQLLERWRNQHDDRTDLSEPESSG